MADLRSSGLLLLDGNWDPTDVLDTGSTQLSLWCRKMVLEQSSLMLPTTTQTRFDREMAEDAAPIGQLVFFIRGCVRRKQVGIVAFITMASLTYQVIERYVKKDYATGKSQNFNPDNFPNPESPNLEYEHLYYLCVFFKHIVLLVAEKRRLFIYIDFLDMFAGGARFDIVMNALIDLAAVQVDPKHNPIILIITGPGRPGCALSIRETLRNRVHPQDKVDATVYYLDWDRDRLEPEPAHVTIED
ncbi:hypothetical protein BDP81DRAFT_448915 [Colletotrichum phormii]|uniref:Uncharacterized protein n=1 Tax=Colletotrichum phormii TaxID=359342 RepID=A0AAI9ZT95_9PEZI|nr:uncharacterized protein BDP81DRAFT_448915 [Colletotrichum phormii]KAK1637797.1 hypothetical protein BDP81DRAFT_448915 [Colletotrichum phormii]